MSHTISNETRQMEGISDGSIVDDVGGEFGGMALFTVHGQDVGEVGVLP